ncbi:CocE/NonD family hydrolase [Chryseobacterium potabilaquae]|uniref:Cocaine esterase n=1 Tax=Chryseobacterium potabilaquae TaxID=2675057 RepID=A0A6N4XAI1_9FLAO|nr:CocE/NonD family hydrolase [Chryseobacterium potabilaquae]CAA7196413.1 Cocaine esterase [Chryseobacterium potabilaquae]
MRKLFVIYFSFFLQFVFCQKLSLKEINYRNTSPENIVKYLANRLKDQYTEKNKAIYYDNLFRINIINENYNLSLVQLDSLRNVNRISNPILSSAMGSQFEIYINTIKRISNVKEFNKIYENEFRRKYTKLPPKSQILLSQYFSYNPVDLEKEINDILKKNIKNDSIDINDAILLCRKYNLYDVGKKTFALGAQLIKDFEREAFTIYDSVKIMTKYNSTLTLSVVLNNKISKSQNTILINTIYSDIKNINRAKALAFDGYVGVILNTRGKYLSNDDLEPFEHEEEDINEIIDWIIKQPWSNGKVGMIGGSYLGFSQWAATKKLHPALKTIIPQAAVGIGIDYPMQNNIFTSYALRWLHYVMDSKMTDYTGFVDSKKWNSLYKNWYINGSSFRQLDSINGQSNLIFQRWLNHPGYDRYWQKMIPYRQDFSKISIPILTTTGYFDDDQLGALYYFKEHNKYDKNANHYLIIGPYDHFGAQGNIKSQLSGYTIDPIASIDLNKIWIEWFDYILKGKKKPDFLKDYINYETIGENVWKSVKSLNELDGTKVKYYLDEDLILSKNQKKQSDFSSSVIDLTDRKDVDKHFEYEYNIIDDILNPNKYLVYTTEVLDKEFELSGDFSGSLSLSINKKDFDISMQLYELLPTGKYFLLSSYIGRASYANDNTKRELLIPNQKVVIPIKNTTFISKKIEKGSKLILLIGANKSPYYQINYGTGKDVSEETITDAKEPLEIKWYNDSYIELPMVEKQSSVLEKK